MNSLEIKKFKYFSLPLQAVTTSYMIAEPFVKGSSADSMPSIIFTVYVNGFLNACFKVVHDMDANVFASPTSSGRILCGGFREDCATPISPEELAEYISREDQSEQWDNFCMSK